MSADTEHQIGHCPNCGHTNPRSHILCYSCHTPLPWAIPGGATRRNANQQATSPTSTTKSASPVTGPASPMSSPPARPAASNRPAVPSQWGNASPKPSGADVTGSTDPQLTAQERGLLMSAGLDHAKNTRVNSYQPRMFTGPRLFGGSVSTIGIVLLLIRVLFLRPAMHREANTDEKVDTFAPSVVDDRGAMQELASEMKNNPDSEQFRVRWMVKQGDGRATYPEIDYNRRTKTITYLNNGSGGATYYKVSDEAIYDVVDEHEEVAALQKHGCTTTPPPEAAMDSEPPESESDESESDEGESEP